MWLFKRYVCFSLQRESSGMWALLSNKWLNSIYVDVIFVVLVVFNETEEEDEGNRNWIRRGQKIYATILSCYLRSRSSKYGKIDWYSYSLV